MSAIDGPSYSSLTADGVGDYLAAASRYIVAVHSIQAVSGWGFGWTPSWQDTTPTPAAWARSLVAGGLASLHSLGSEFGEAIEETFSGVSCVTIHRDVKPTHFIRNPQGLHLLDWEQAARGPAALDTGNLIFSCLATSFENGSPVDTRTAARALDRAGCLLHSERQIVVAIAWKALVWGQYHVGADLVAVRRIVDALLDTWSVSSAVTTVASALTRGKS